MQRLPCESHLDWGDGMKQYHVELRAIDPDGTSADIMPLCRQVSWSGDYRSVARTLKASPLVSSAAQLPRAPIAMGGSVQLKIDGTVMHDGWTMDRTRDSLSHFAELTVYDRGLYLKRNSTYLRVEGQTPESVTRSLCGAYGIEVGSLVATRIPITRNFFGVNLYQIIMTMYSLAADQTGEKYRIRFRGAVLEVVRMEQSTESILLRPGSNLLSSTIRENAANMTNSVAIYDDNCVRVSTQKDMETISLFGLMEAAVKASAYEDPVAHAKKVLRESGLQTTISLQAIGNPKLITGNTVVVHEPVTDTYGLFWITSDTHTWNRGIYQTKVSLSLEALMDRQSAGSVPTE